MQAMKFQKMKHNPTHYLFVSLRDLENDWPHRTIAKATSGLTQKGYRVIRIVRITSLPSSLENSITEKLKKIQKWTAKNA